MSTSPEDEFTRAEVEAAVRAVETGWEVEDVARCEGGTDTLYFVTVATARGRRELVLKACTYVEPEAFRVEPYVLAVLADRTSIPVPEVVGTVDDHPDLPTPFFLMERRAGEQIAEDDLSIDALGRVAYEAGRHLGELHALGSFNRYGDLRCRRDDPTVRPGIVAADCVLGVSDGTDSWREWLLPEFESALGDIDGRFRDLAVDLRAFVESEAYRIEDDGPPVLIDEDYWYGNVLLDPDTGATRAVLDFGDTHTATAEYNLALTEQFLCEFAPLDSDRRRRVHERLYDGYEETKALDRGDQFERRRKYYLVTTWIGPLVLFSDWYAPEDSSGRDELATRYRTALETLMT
jgi:aminoglycoside phosphotransferase (APT) family kinase protein